MENLSDDERKIINNNWNNILKQVQKDEINTLNLAKLNISFIDREDNIQLILEYVNKSQKCKRLIISKKAKIMNFKIDDKSNEELVYEPNSIYYLTKYYKMQHPVYKKCNSDNDDKILDISVDPSNYEEIFNNSNVTEIYDDKFDRYINEKEYLDYFKNLEKKASDFYDNLSKNNYSKKIKDDKILYSKERKELIKFINDLTYSKENFIFIIGCQKIGLSFTILQEVKNLKILYLNFEELFNIKKHSDKRKYIFRKLFNLFDDFKTYETFINEEIFNIRGYDNILNVVKLLINSVCDYTKENDCLKYIILDNYDDFLVDALKLEYNYIDYLYNKLDKKENIKIIILGKGKFISKLLLNYIFEPNEIKPYIIVKYVTSLNLNIENDIHSHNIKNGINEIVEYYNEKYTNNTEYKIYNLVILKNLPYLINQSYSLDIPFQFFKFKMVNNKLEINYQFEDIIDENKKAIRAYIAKLNTLKNFSELQNEKIKGYVFEDLVISQFINNKTFQNLVFQKQNIIEIEAIYNMENIIKKTNLKDGPILIIPKKNGEVLDFGFIINKDNKNYFIGGKIGLNKSQEDIVKYIKKIESNENLILDNIKNLTGREVQEFRFIIIFNKEWQSELYREYTKFYLKANNKISNKKMSKSKSKKKKKTSFERRVESKNKDKLNHFNSNYGIQCCKNENITYILFSNTDFKFYNYKNEEITNFNVDNIHPIKKGFQKFVFNEYDLIPFKDDNILTKSEKGLLLNEIQKKNNIIKNIEIKYKLKETVPLLTGIPINTGILSITKKIKVFTYYDDYFTHYLLKNNKISLYPQTGKLFDDTYNKEEILSQYFVIFKLDNEISLDEDINNNLK